MFIVLVWFVGEVNRFMMSDSDIVDIIVLFSFCMVCVVISSFCEFVSLYVVDVSVNSVSLSRNIL